MANRRISSEQLLKMLNYDGVINTVLMTDEAHYHLSGYVNKQNYRYWAPEIHKISTAKDWLSGVGSHLLEFLALTSLKTTNVQPLLWHPSAMWQCYATCVNQSYVVVGSISHQYGFSQMEQQPTQHRHQWMFCGKCFHNTSFPVAALFHGQHVRLISPPVVFFLWGYLKSRVFISRPRTIAELKQSTMEEIAAIPEQMTRQVLENLGVILKQCLRNGGRHLSDVLFKT